MAERSIIFSAPMVRAILRGEKSQTRRVVKLPAESTLRGGWEATTVGGPGVTRADGSPAPAKAAIWNQTTGTTIAYGDPGDRLWVREVWRPEERASDMVDGVRFAADDAFLPIENTREAADRWVDARYPRANFRIPADRWRTPIFMPRWASRITLVVTKVRVERLHAITDADVRAEGVAPDSPAELLEHAADHDRGWAGVLESTDWRGLWAARWDTLHSKDAPWASDPWVWVLEFRRAEGDHHG